MGVHHQVKCGYSTLAKSRPFVRTLAIVMVVFSANPHMSLTNHTDTLRALALNRQSYERQSQITDFGGDADIMSVARAYQQREYVAILRDVIRQ